MNDRTIKSEAAFSTAHTRVCHSALRPLSLIASAENRREAILMRRLHGCNPSLSGQPPARDFISLSTRAGIHLRFPWKKQADEERVRG